MLLEFALEMEKPGSYDVLERKGSLGWTIQVYHRKYSRAFLQAPINGLWEFRPFVETLNHFGIWKVAEKNCIMTNSKGNIVLEEQTDLLGRPFLPFIFSHNPSPRERDNILTQDL